jgi:hypothetical protein
MGQWVSSFHRELNLFDVFHTKSLSANNAYSHCFVVFILFKAIVTFQHMTTSTNFIKRTVIFQGFMAGQADNPFDMFDIGFQLDRIVSFPGRSFLMNEVIFANPSPTNNTNCDSISIFAFSGTFITFHSSPSKLFTSL